MLYNMQQLIRLPLLANKARKTIEWNSKTLIMGYIITTPYSQEGTLHEYHVLHEGQFKLTLQLVIKNDLQNNFPDEEKIGLKLSLTGNICYSW